jgi:glycosyltransferase involved in cell wall biosynthesis
MKKASLEEVLEIFLITSNRSACLDNTLNQLKDSPFARCRFTILDNCSTDDTPSVTAKYQDQFPDYHVIRHSRNIGGNNNYLRAVELSKALYTWILCDDDNYDFSRVSGVIEAIESCQYDIIYVGSRAPKHLGWKDFGATTAGQLVKEGARYHRALCFYPAMIFKAQQWDHECFINAAYLFPSILFINKSVRDEYSIYIAESEIVIRFEGTAPEISPLYLYKEWVINAAKIKDVRLRESVIYQWTDEGFLITMFFWVALEKTLKREGFSRRIIDIFFGYTLKQRLKFILLVPVMIIPIPKSLLLRARELAYRLKGHKDLTILPPVQIEQRVD